MPEICLHCVLLQSPLQIHLFTSGVKTFFLLHHAESYYQVHDLHPFVLNGVFLLVMILVLSVGLTPFLHTCYANAFLQLINCFNNLCFGVSSFFSSFQNISANNNNFCLALNSPIFREAYNPNLESIKDFIESYSYLAGINILIYAKQEVLDNLTQKEKLFCAIEVLRQIEPLLSKGGIGYKGTKLFRPKQIKDVFRERKQKFSLDGSSDKELGKSMMETENMYLRMDLSKADWHAYEDCFGTSEEKHLIRYIESIFPKLAEKYHDIYLLRNERDLKIYSFTSEDAYQPDYVLFLKKKNDNAKTDYIQIFIEPKGEHLRSTDKWKEDAMKQIRENADIRFSTQSTNFNVWGMPFFTESKRHIFDIAIKQSLEN